MKSGPIFLLYLILLAYFNLFGSLDSASDDFKLGGVVDDSQSLVFSSKENSLGSDAIIEKPSYRNSDLIAPSKQVNRFRIIRKPVFSIRPLLNLQNLSFQPHFLRPGSREAAIAARFPIFPLRI